VTACSALTALSAHSMPTALVTQRTALIVVRAGKDALDALLEAGADPAVAVSSGLTPLEAAARVINDYAIEKLIEYGTNPNKLPPNGFAPLYFVI